MSENGEFFYFDEKQLKKDTKRLCHSYAWWWILRIAAVVCVLLGIVYFAYPAVLYSTGKMQALIASSKTITILLIITAGLSIFLMCASVALWREASFVYGMPYTARKESIIYVTPNEIGIEFHNKYDRKHKEGTDVARVKISNVERVTEYTDANIYIISGTAEFIQYEDMSENKILHTYTEGQLENNAIISFSTHLQDKEHFEEVLEESGIDIYTNETPFRKCARETPRSRTVG